MLGWKNLFKTHQNLYAPKRDRRLAEGLEHEHERREDEAEVEGHIAAAAGAAPKNAIRLARAVAQREPLPCFTQKADFFTSLHPFAPKFCIMSGNFV